MAQTVRKYAIESKTKLLLKHSIIGHHLDIGSGTGEYLNSCSKEGYKCIGIEPSKIAREQAENNFNLMIKENIDLKQFSNDTFDSISMWHVLEHVYKLDETIKNLVIQKWIYRFKTESIDWQWFRDVPSLSFDAERG